MQNTKHMKRYSVEREKTKESLVALYIRSYYTILDSDMNIVDIIKNQDIFNFKNKSLIKIGATDCYFGDIFPGCLKVVFNSKEQYNNFISNIEKSIPKDFKIIKIHNPGAKIKQILVVKRKTDVTI